jgi:putative membrane protein
MRLIAVASAIAVLALPVSAQIGNPAGVDPASPQGAPGVPASHFANTQDKLFAQLVAAGGMAEVEFGKIADSKAQSSSVKLFAKRMLQDHSRANEQLAPLAKQASIPLPSELAPDDKGMKEELDKSTGRTFDLTYMQGQLVGHQKAVILLQYEIGQGQNPDLQKFAAETLPAVLAHLEMARGIMDELRDVTTQATVGTGRDGSPESPPSPRQGQQNAPNNGAKK